MIGLLLGVVVMTADTNHFTVCRTLPHTSDTTTRTIYAFVSDPFTGLPLPSGFSGVVAEAVRTKMKVPADLPPVVLDDRGRPTIVMTAAFSVMTNGTTRNVAVMSSSSSLAIDSVLTVAIEAASQDSSFPPLPPRAGNGIRLSLTLSPDSAAGAVPMFTVHVPVWREFATADKPTNPGHPGDRVPMDTVTADFVVDERGMPMLGTVHIVRATGSGVARGYLDWLKTTHFEPGHIEQCAVRSLVHLSGLAPIARS